MKIDPNKVNKIVKITAIIASAVIEIASSVKEIMDESKMQD